MKLIVDISEYNYEYIKNAYEVPQDINTVVAEAIINGEQIPTPQTGKWDSLGGIMDVGDGEEIQCNKCKSTYMIVYRDSDYNFCPNCGADMRGETDRTCSSYRQ